VAALDEGLDAQGLHIGAEVLIWIVEVTDHEIETAQPLLEGRIYLGTWGKKRCHGAVF
jgi:hypothetical protein